MYSIKCIVNNIVITSVTDDSWIYPSDHFLTLINVESLPYTPETNIIGQLHSNKEGRFRL